jgi:hypothetical protein
VQNKRKQYFETSSNQEKKNITSLIVQEIRESGGRFLKDCPHNNQVFYEMSLEQACIKVAQTLQYRQRCARDAGVVDARDVADAVDRPNNENNRRNRRQNNPPNERDENARRRNEQENLPAEPFRPENDLHARLFSDSIHGGFRAANEIRDRGFSGGAHHGFPGHDETARHPMHVQDTAEYQHLLIAIRERDGLRHELNRQREETRRLREYLRSLEERQPGAHRRRSSNHYPSDDTDNFAS